MKKSYLIIATSLLLTACTSETELISSGVKTQQEQVPINFSSYMGRSTRAGQAGAMTTSLLKSEGFGVFAYYTEGSDYDGTTKPNFMYNQKVYYPSDAWTYSPLKYWPNDNTTADNNGATGTTLSKMSFFAYAPYVGNETTGVLADGETSGITAITPAASGTGDPVIAYTLSNDATQNVDLLWGTVADDATSWANVTSTTAQTLTAGGPFLNLLKPKTGQKISFSFKHVLAMLDDIKIVADIDEDGEISGGTLDANTKIGVESIIIDCGNIHHTGLFNLRTGEWSAGSDTPASFAYTVSGTQLADAIKDVAAASWTALPTAFTGVPSTTAVTVFPDGFTAKHFFLPSTSASWKVKITYYVMTRDEHMVGGWTRVKQTIQNTLTLTSGLLKNKKYTLTIHLGLTSAKFTGTVANWDDTSVDTKVDLPINVQ